MASWLPHTERGKKLICSYFKVSSATYLCKPMLAGSDTIWLFLRSSHSRLGRLMNSESGISDMWLPSRYKYWRRRSEQLEWTDEMRRSEVDKRTVHTDLQCAILQNTLWHIAQLGSSQTKRLCGKTLWELLRWSDVTVHGNEAEPQVTNFRLLRGRHYSQKITFLSVSENKSV